MTRVKAVNKLTIVRLRWNFPVLINTGEFTIVDFWRFDAVISYQSRFKRLYLKKGFPSIYRAPTAL